MIKRMGHIGAKCSCGVLAFVVAFILPFPLFSYVSHTHEAHLVQQDDVEMMTFVF